MPNNPKKVRCCSLSYCQRDKGKSLSLHSLPQDSIERNQWIQILSINTEVMPKPILVCSRHFNTKDFVTHGSKNKIKRLKKHILPSRMLPIPLNDPQHIALNQISSASEPPPEAKEEKPLTSTAANTVDDSQISRFHREHSYSFPLPALKIESKYKYPRVCCVGGCGANESNQDISLHKFPKDNKIAMRWKRKLKIKSQSSVLRVCSKHFNSTDFFPLAIHAKHRRRLKPNVVPLSASQLNDRLHS